jgi:hypothetical protein
VLYLLHGSGGDEEASPVMGIANMMMDNLIAQGKAKPMIVGLPNAYWNEYPRWTLPVRALLRLQAWLGHGPCRI